MELESTVKLIGCLVIAMLIFAIPCVTTLAWVLNWNVVLKYVLTMVLIGGVVIAAASLYGSVD